MTDILAKARRLLPVLLLVGFAGAATADTEILDRVVAIVDSDVILASELQQRMQQAEQAIRQSDQPMPDEALLRREVLDRLILESIQLQMAERAGVRISDAQLNEAMSRVAAQNNMDLAAFRAALEEEGLSYQATREQIRQDLLLQRVQQGNVNQRIQITDQEIDNFLESEEGRRLTSAQYNVLHALVPLSADAGADRVSQAERFARRLAESVREGQPVEAVEGDFTVQQSDLGWRRQHELPSLIAQLVPEMEDGEVAAPIRSPSGYHVVQLVESRGRAEMVRQTRARHILLKPSAIRSEEETRELAAQLRQRALAGGSFAELAREYSEDIGSAMEGGDLGWTRPGQLVPAFQQAMDNTAPGEISEPFRSQYGWHIVKVEERRMQDITDDMRRNMARNFIHQRKFDEELEVWQQKIRDEAYVDLKL